MAIKFTNNAKTKLAAGVSAVDTVLAVSTTTGGKLPALPGGDGHYCVLTIEDASGNREFVRVDRRIGDTVGDGTYPCVRGYYGSTARVWPSGVTVDLRWTAESIENYLHNLAGRYLGQFAAAPTFDSYNVAVIAGDLYINSATGLLMIYNGATWSSAITLASYLQLAGGTMAGHITLPGGGTGNQAVTKTELDASSAAAVASANGTSGAALTAHTGDATDAHAASAITFTPSGTLAATTVQAAISEAATDAVQKAGSTMTGQLTLPGGGTGSQAVTRTETDAAYPTKAGVGASGSWGIDVTGSAASCTGNAATATQATNATNVNGGSVSATTGVFSGSLTVGNGSANSSILMYDSDEGNRTFHCDSNNIGFLTQAGGWGSWSDDTGNWYAAANVVSYASDARLKKNFAVIQDALYKVSLLGGYEFDWDMDVCRTAGFFPTAQHEHGVKAQEVLAVVPSAVHQAPFDAGGGGKSISGEHYLTVNYERLVPLLIAAINELRAEVESLKAVVNHDY